VFGHKLTSGDHLFCSVYAFGIRPQVHYGSLVLFSVYAFGTRRQVHCGSLVLFNLSMLSALDNKSAVGHLFYSICPCLRQWTASSLWVTCSVLSIHAFGTGRQAHWGSLVLFYLSRNGITPPERGPLFCTHFAALLKFWPVMALACGSLHGCNVRAKRLTHFTPTFLS
jgi:hypothetical protein